VSFYHALDTFAQKIKFLNNKSRAQTGGWLLLSNYGGVSVNPYALKLQQNQVTPTTLIDL